jgi:hypothetical protein
MRFSAIISITVCLFLLFGCSGKVEKKEAAPNNTSTMDPQEAALRAAVIESFDRIREGDKTVLYENEFTYLKDTMTLSAYLESKYVKKYNDDSLRNATIDSVEFMGDSAKAFIHLIYESLDGSEITRDISLRLFLSQGRWIKPYLSKYLEEKDYLEQRRIYDSLTNGQ